MKLKAKGSINSGAINIGDNFEASETEGTRLIEMGVAEKLINPLTKVDVVIEDTKPESTIRKPLPGTEELRKVMSPPTVTRTRKKK